MHPQQSAAGGGGGQTSDRKRIRVVRPGPRREGFEKQKTEQTRYMAFWLEERVRE